MRHLVPKIFVASALTLLAVPATTLACSFSPSPELQGYPGDDALLVPTDVIPLYAVPAPTGGDTAAWVASATLQGGADAIPLTPRDVEGTYVEFVPQRALLANTEYTLSVVWAARLDFRSPGQDGLSFTTGAGPAEVDASAPRASISHYANGSSSSCAASTNSCISLTDDEVYLWQFVGAEYKRVTVGSFQTNMFGAEQGHPYDCIVLQRRAANGVLGDSSTICTFDGLMFDVASLHSEREVAPLSSPLSCDRSGLKWSDKSLSKLMRGKPPIPYDQNAPKHRGTAQPLQPLSSDGEAALVSGDPEATDGGCSALPMRNARGGVAMALLGLALCCARWRGRSRAGLSAVGTSPIRS